MSSMVKGAVVDIECPSHRDREGLARHVRRADFDFTRQLWPNEVEVCPFRSYNVQHRKLFLWHFEMTVVAHCFYCLCIYWSSRSVLFVELLRGPPGADCHLLCAHACRNRIPRPRSLLIPPIPHSRHGSWAFAIDEHRILDG